MGTLNSWLLAQTYKHVCRTKQYTHPKLRWVNWKFLNVFINLSFPSIYVNTVSMGPEVLTNTVFSFFVSCSLLTLVWRRSTETIEHGNTSLTEKTRIWLAQHATPPSMHIWASNKGLWRNVRKKQVNFNVYKISYQRIMDDHQEQFIGQESLWFS